MLNALRTDVQSDEVIRKPLSYSNGLRLRAGIEFVSGDVVHRQQELHVATFRLLQNLSRQIKLIFLNPRLPYRMPMCLQEGVGHGTANDERVHLREQVLDHSDLVANLRTAKNRHKRLLGMLHHSA